MKLKTNIKSIEAEIQRGRLVVWSKTPLKILSSAVLNGGLQDANGIMSIQVPEDCGMDIADEVHSNPEDFLRKEASKLNLSQDKVVGLMTAADLQNAEVTSRRYEDITLSVLVTAGISFSATAGDEIASKYGSFRFKEFGTINIIVLIDGNLTESCMVNAANTITEAKTVAIRELDIRSRFSGDLASGTVTDSVVVACTKRGSPIKYAGTATIMGELIGKSVKELVKKVIHKQENFVPNRPLTKRLEERGISIADITTLFSQVHPALRESAEKWGQFTDELQRVLSDQNIGSLVIAGLRLDDDAKTGLIPVDAYDKKSVVCGILQTAVADYLSKKDVTSEYIEPELSSAVADKTGFFTRSILFAVMNSIYSNIGANHFKKCE